MIEATMFLDNTVLERPKQLEIGGKKIAKKRISMENSREKSLWKNLFLTSCRHIASYSTNRELLS